MIEFGLTLKKAREAKGMTIAQLAETTHMAPAMVGELEAEDFHRITAPIYGRGFIKLYCEAVGIDPQPLLAGFMDIYTGNRKPTIRERPVETTVEVPPATAPVPSEPVPSAEPPSPVESPSVAEPTAASPQADDVPIQPERTYLFSELEPPTSERPRPATPKVQDPPSANLPGTPEQNANGTSLSRYTAPFRQMHDTATNSSALRLGLLAVGALVILWLGFLGLRALYRATSAPVPESRHDAQTAEQAPVTAPPPEAAPAPRPTPTKKRPAGTPTKPTARTPQKIPSLYID